MTTYVQVAVNVPGISGVFDYHLTPEIEPAIPPGCLVEVPFGKQTVQGVVLRPVETPQVPETRTVQSLLDPQPVLTSRLMALASWLSEQTFSPLSACLNLMIPPGLSQQADTLYIQINDGGNMGTALSVLQTRILQEIGKQSEKALRGRQLEARFAHQNWKAAAQALVRSGILQSRSVLPPPNARPRYTRTASLAVPPEEASQQMGNLAKSGSEALSRRQAILQFLIRENLPVDVSWVYAASGGNLQDLHALAEKGLITLGESETWRDPLGNIEQPLQTPPMLTHHQQAAWQTILQILEQRKSANPILLHGVTGSGKTEIYLRAVENTLQSGRQAIILVPEISLTPQTVRRFMGRFPGQVGLVHSRLSAGERFDTWRRARAGRLPIIVGARSALFTPLPDPGLIVVDECHDDSYSQDEILPYYHAVPTARAYARLCECELILGSATPDINLYYQAQREAWPVVKLPERILAHRKTVRSRLASLNLEMPLLEGEEESTFLPLPPVAVVDMRQEFKNGNTSIFSHSLQDSLREVLENHQQAILFLNRRGNATYVFCRDCGYTLRCPHCDLPLTLHGTENQVQSLICHTCGYRRQTAARCPRCRSARFRQYGMGTEKVENELLKLFPEVQSLRWDASTAHGKDAHEMILSHFANHHADVLVGTQMLAKGLDLPLVTLVGVVLADVGLNLPDFRAAERTFQLLTQVAGRAGRSPLGGKVILQTFQPDSYPIRAASQHDYAGFFQQEIEKRRQMGYPPFSRLVRLEYRHADPEQARQSAQRLALQVHDWIRQGGYKATDIIGPAPCFFQRMRGQYRWQIILRGPRPLEILRQHALEGWRIEIVPISLL